MSVKTFAIIIELSLFVYKLVVFVKSDIYIYNSDNDSVGNRQLPHNFCTTPSQIVHWKIQSRGCSYKSREHVYCSGVDTYWWYIMGFLIQLLQSKNYRNVQRLSFNFTQNLSLKFDYIYSIWSCSWF